MKIIEGEQYTDLWHAVRRGIPTASEMGRIITPAQGKLSASADGYIAQLIGDLLDPFYPRKDSIATAAMRNGTMMEPESRRFYEMDRACEVKQVCFCISDCGRFGSSVDGLIGDDGCLECKNPSPAVHVSYLLNGTLPIEYKAQVNWHLVVTGRKWTDFLSYCPGFAPFLVRVEPDDFTKKLAECLEQFHEKYLAALKKLGLERPSQAEVAA